MNWYKLLTFTLTSMKNVSTKVNLFTLLNLFTSWKEFQRCPEDTDIFETFNSGRLLAIFLVFSPQNFPTNAKNL